MRSKTTYIILLCLLIQACRPTGVVTGALGFKAQEGHPLIAYVQPCQQAAWTVATADGISTIIQQESAKVGLDWIDPGKWYVCLVEQPQECIGPSWIKGPCITVEGEKHHCVRLRGCTTYKQTWVSRMWPPVCSAVWPKEPTCSSTRPQTNAGTVANFAHELVEVQAYLHKTSAHVAPWSTVDKAVLSRLQELGLSEP